MAVPDILVSRRKPWFQKFRASLTNTKSVEDIRHLLRYKAERWRNGKQAKPKTSEESGTWDTDEELCLGNLNCLQGEV